MAQGRLQATAGIKPDLTTKGERSLLAEPSDGFGADNIFSQTINARPTQTVLMPSMYSPIQMEVKYQ